jgi:hypothetical protein
MFGRLEEQVGRINRQYLVNKKALIEHLYEMHIRVLEDGNAARGVFVEQTKRFHQNRMSMLLREARRQLDPMRAIDFGDVLDRFHAGEASFAQVCQRQLQGIFLVYPPKHFAQEDLEQWWQGYEEFLACHNTFIETFTRQIAQKMQEMDTQNVEILGAVEQQLASFPLGDEFSDSVFELQPLLANSKKVHQKVLTYITDYWKFRTGGICANFKTLFDFFGQLISLYSTLPNDYSALKSKVATNEADLAKKSQETLDSLEQSLAQKIAEIYILVAEKDIDARVSDCRQILAKIETEYRTFFARAVAVFDPCPEAVQQLHEKCEGQVLSLLKLRKLGDPIAETAAGGGGSKGGVSRRGMKKKPPPRKAKREEDAPIDTPRVVFATTSGVRFEEVEPIKVFAPDTGEPPEQPPSAKGARPKPRVVVPPRGRRTPPGVRGGKTGTARFQSAPEPEDVDVDPKAMIPEIDGRPAIWVYIPQNEDLTEMLNEFRGTLVNEVTRAFDIESALAGHGSETEALKVQLDERLRLHSPRANGIDLNIAQNRKMKIHSRQSKLEKYFRTVVDNFNQGYLKKLGELTRLLDGMIARASGFDHFQADLAAVDSLRASGELKSAYLAQQSAFMLEFDTATKEQLLRLDDFAKGFQASNDRVLGTLDESFSPKERAISLSYFKRFDAQVVTILAQFREKERTARLEIEDKLKKLGDEFEFILPHHESDIRLTERLSQLLADAQYRYGTLLFRSDQSAADLVRIVSRVEESRNLELDNQPSILRQFEALDDARIAVLRRAKYLNALTTDIPVEPKKMVIDFVHNDLSPSANSTLRQEAAAADKRKARPVSRMQPAKRKPPTKSDSKQQPKAFEGSLSTQIDAIGVEVIAKATAIANEYYSQLKGRKFAITRPQKIPPSVSECAERVRTRWKQIIENAAELNAKAAMDLIAVVCEMVTSCRRSVISMSEHLFDFYQQLGSENRSEIESSFRESHGEQMQLRDAHWKRLNIQMADPNRRMDWESIQCAEGDRRECDDKIINEYRSRMFTSEVDCSKLFVAKLHEFTCSLLDLLDGFVFPEDIVCRDHPPNIQERPTLRGRLKEQQRRKANPENVTGRAFYLRAWPQMTAVMATADQLLQIIATETQPADAPPAQTASPVASRSRKTPRKRVEKAPVDAAPKQFSGSSLETQLHRVVVMQSERCYQEFEAKMKARIEQFNQVIQDMTDESTTFVGHWNRRTNGIGLSAAFQGPPSSHGRLK